MALATINGIKLDYTDVGQGAAVVLLHGLGSTKKDWDLQIPVLSQKFRVIAPDFRAHGNSERIPAEQGVEVMADDIAELLRYLKIPSASFVGFSMGGAVAFELAYKQPAMVEKLVILNSGPDFNTTAESGVDILAERTKIIKEQGFDQLAKNIAGGMFPDDTQQTWRLDFEQRLLRNDEDAYLRTFGELMNWGMKERLEKLSQPTLIIASDQDYTPLSFKESYAARMQNAKLVVIENSRHGVVLDQAEKLNDELMKFLLA